MCCTRSKEKHRLYEGAMLPGNVPMIGARRDEAILGVAFFKRYGANHAEVGCLAIHHDYRKVRNVEEV